VVTLTSTIPLCTSIMNRRAYDRSLIAEGPSRSAPTSAYSHTHAAGHWAHEHDSGPWRRPGATHAWQKHHAPGAGPYWRGHPRSSPYTHPQAGPEYHRDPFSSPNVRRATGHNAPRSSRTHSETDRLNHVSSFWRAVQMVGIVILVVTVGGGFSANA
jgi:hypothetical protein